LFGKTYSQSGTFKLTDTKVSVGDTCLVELIWGEEKYGYFFPLADSIRIFLEKNPTVSVEIRNYTDMRGALEYNDTLSYRTASIIKAEALKYSQIDSNRIIPIGFGERFPVVITKTIHAAYPFLPVGQVLSDEFIKSLATTKEKEIAHGFNRRTVIKIKATK
jgi:outer membrane protein OmpA-like peptidoglycan-associated protein